MKDQKIDALISECEEQLKWEGVKEYRVYARNALASRIDSAMRACMSYLPKKDQGSFHMFVRVNGDGTISDWAVFPQNPLGRCFGRLMSRVQYTPHTFDSFLFDIKMNVVE